MAHFAEKGLHDADWSGSLPGEPPSCACGYNGTPEECANSRDGWFYIEDVMYLGTRDEERGPCPAKVLAVLGLPEPVMLPCGLLARHVGPHHYRIEWTDDKGGDQ